jgi:3-methylcrotonyl-CoA carboxylase alpha subunit
VKTYHIRVDSAAASQPGEGVLEVAVEETPAGLRAAARRPGATGALAWHRVDLAEILPGWYSLILDGRSHTLGVATWRAGGADPRVGGAAPRHWTFVFDGEAVTVDVGRSARGRGPAQSAAAGAAGQVRAPMPGLVVAIQADPGTAVTAGQPLIIMEAMKMQMEIRAPHAGVVREVRVVPGQDVAGNDVLATLE